MEPGGAEREAGPAAAGGSNPPTTIPEEAVKKYSAGCGDEEELVFE